MGKHLRSTVRGWATQEAEDAVKDDEGWLKPDELKLLINETIL